MRHDLNSPEPDAFLCVRCEEQFYASGPDTPTCPHCGAQDATSVVLMEEELEEEYSPN